MDKTTSTLFINQHHDTKIPKSPLIKVESPLMTYNWEKTIKSSKYYYTIG